MLVVAGVAQTNDLFMLNQDRMEWVRLEVTGAIPPPRDGHCAVSPPLERNAPQLDITSFAFEPWEPPGKALPNPPSAPPSVSQL